MSWLSIDTSLFFVGISAGELFDVLALIDIIVNGISVLTNRWFRCGDDSEHIPHKAARRISIDFYRKFRHRSTNICKEFSNRKSFAAFNSRLSRRRIEHYARFVFASAGIEFYSNEQIWIHLWIWNRLEWGEPNRRYIKAFVWFEYSLQRTIRWIRRGE